MTGKENEMTTLGDWGDSRSPGPVQSMIPETAADALAQWDRGESVWTVEMGGIGPGYEQAIQVGVFEMLRSLVGKDLPTDRAALDEFLDVALDRIDKNASIGGLSGAQAGAIKWLAYKTLTQGWRFIVEKHPQDRRILVSKNWPKS